MKKEVRALLPLWATAVAAVATISLVFPEWPTSARMIYGLLSISLAAMSIGQEYLYGTMAALLTLPATRRRLLANKLAALAPMLVTLALLARILLPPDPAFDRNTALPRLSLLFAVLSAPFFTMLCRSPLGGVAFAFGFPGGMQLLATTGWHPWVLGTASGLAVLGGWQLFMRLEVIDAGSASLDLPRWFRGPSTPAWLLVQKELRLQQMAFLVATFYVLLWSVVTTVWWDDPRVPGTLAVVGSAYGGLLAVLVGALASAEERQMQTLEWQLLMPIAGWKQWTVKVCVAIGVALALCLVMPIVLAAGEMGFSLVPAAGVIVVTVGSLYISSLCRSSLAAMAIAGPVMFTVLLAAVSWVAPAVLGGALYYPLVLVTIAFLALALWFAYANHTSAGRDTARVSWQLAWMALLLTVLRVAY